MPARSPRTHTAIRLPDDLLGQVEQLAVVETESNVSAMIRKLVGEALAARDHREDVPR